MDRYRKEHARGAQQDALKPQSASSEPKSPQAQCSAQGVGACTLSSVRARRRRGVSAQCVVAAVPDGVLVRLPR
eukprot:4752386-Pleurochrysis_carterae.AAC.1